MFSIENKQVLKNIFLPLIVSMLFYACKENSQHNAAIISQDKTHQNYNVNIHVDTLEFLNLKDSGTYLVIIARDQQNKYAFISEKKNNDAEFSLGDSCIITWQDTLHTSIIPDKNILSIRNMKRGIVHNFKSIYPKPIKYHFYENIYSKNFLDSLYILVEYYIALSSNPLLQLSIKNQEELSYSIEEKNLNGIPHQMIGIGVSSEHKFNVMQWIYVNIHNQSIKEYDIAGDRIIDILQY